MKAETPVVLIVEEDRDRAELYASWLAGECEVRVAHDAPGALDALDRDVDVAVLGRPGTWAGSDDVLSAVRDRGSEVGVAMVRGSDADLEALTRAPDEVLPAPVTPSALRRTVSVLAAGRAYARGIRDLFSLARERAAVESGEAPGPDGDLDDRVADLRDRLDGTLDTLIEEAGVDAVYRALPEDLEDRNGGRD